LESLEREERESVQQQSNSCSSAPMLVAKIKDEIALWSLAGAKELSNIMACKTLSTTFFLINENSKSFVLFKKN
jgi:hypothetical protein